MTTPEQQAATQLANIERDSGLTPAKVADLATAAGLDKHGQIVAMLKAEHGITHGNANALAVRARELLAGGPATDAELLDAQYAGGKAHLRAIHDEVVAAAVALGDDVDVVVQKTGVSLRRAKQFALIRPASSTRVELGINLPSTPASARVREAGGMCSHRIDLHDVADLDDDVARWLGEAYAAAG